MWFFGRKKEDKKRAPACACHQQAEDASCNAAPTGEAAETACGGAVSDEISSIKVLGSGCKSCHTLYENVQEAVKSMGLGIEAEYVTDMEKIMAYGVMRMPALVINERVVSMGKVLKAGEIEKLMHQ